MMEVRVAIKMQVGNIGYASIPGKVEAIAVR
jgi:hypothetical protein